MFIFDRIEKKLLGREIRIFTVLQSNAATSFSRHYCFHHCTCIDSFPDPGCEESGVVR